MKDECERYLCPVCKKETWTYTLCKEMGDDFLHYHKTSVFLCGDDTCIEAYTKEFNNELEADSL